MNSRESGKPAVALLTGGGDRPYAIGLGTSLASNGVVLDLIGSDELDCPEFRRSSRINFLNLRGDQRPEASIASKIFRVLRYYARLVRYAATAKPKIFHILWNNKVETFDRTLLMLYYRLLRKKIVLTVHNVNAGRRDSNDTMLNRLTLRIQYRLADHIFVHTEKMKRELITEFAVTDARVTVIPLGINDSVPNTALTTREAKQRLGIRDEERVVLFFGRITPYKGLEYLIAAVRTLPQHNDYRLIIAGRPDKCERYWHRIRQDIRDEVGRSVLLRSEFIPDDETELYFKAADVLVLPYRHIYESGVLFLGYSFGLPALVADVGSLKDEVIEGKTGFVFKPEDPGDLTKTIEGYFASDLYRNLTAWRSAIRNCASGRHSWDKVSQAIVSVYAGLLQAPFPTQFSNNESQRAPLDAALYEGAERAAGESDQSRHVVGVKG